MTTDKKKCDAVVHANIVPPLFLLLALVLGGLGHCTGEWYMPAVRIAPANQDGGNHAAVDLGRVRCRGGCELWVWEARAGVDWGVQSAYRVFEVG